jgi:large subunit ribosomal protein L10
MSKPVKNMIVAEYRRRFDGVSNALLIDIRGIEANENNELRQGLHTSDIRVTVIRNKLAKDAFKDTSLEALNPALVGPNAMCYGANSVVEVARQLVDWAKKIKELELKGACLDGEYFEGQAGVKRLSTFPTRDEAQAKVVQLMLSPAGNLISAATSAGSNVMGIIKEIQERLEKGEEIAKVG